MINIKHYRKFIEGCREALDALRNEIEGRPYNPDIANFIYKDGDKIYQKFINEFYTSVFNNLDRRENLIGYFQEVYYNGIVKLWMDFNLIELARRKCFPDDSIEIYEDDLYTRIENGYCYTFYIICDKILTESKKHQIGLINYFDITRRHYNISGQYIPLFKKKVNTIKIDKPLSHCQIALFHIYQLINIPDPRSDEERKADKIALDFGWKSGTSGLQIYNKFRELEGSSSQRTGVKDKKKMIKDIETILPYLNDEVSRKKARVDLMKLNEPGQNE